MCPRDFSLCVFLQVCILGIFSCVLKVQKFCKFEKIAQIFIKSVFLCSKNH